ncbi:MAG: LptF/LptG family permease [Gemmataceae bacterium]|nr:LptF/LptG family permease [Gemmataceae bacterium]MCI0742503.1 LptF/LptG family permease [Gemmataceae bacterium]
MFTLLDRQLTYSFLKAYFVCLVSLVGLVIIVDMFTNIDEFALSKDGNLLERIVLFYGIKTTQIFDRLCEAVVLLAAMFTVAWMQKNNEMLPLLSAGVSTRRVVRPILIASCLVLGLAILNQELVLPQIDVYTAEDRTGDKSRQLIVQGGFESNGIHISGRAAFRDENKIVDFAVNFPAKIGFDRILTLQAKEARYVPPDSSDPERSGGWMLTGAIPAEVPAIARVDVLTSIAPGKYFLKTHDIDFEAITRLKNWFIYRSTSDLKRELAKTHSTQVAAVAVVFHMRFTRPVLGMLLVFMGLSIILRDQNRNIFISAGLCVVLCGVFFVSVFFCKHLGDQEFLTPALAAWLPVVTFGPMSLVMFDAVHT